MMAAMRDHNLRPDSLVVAAIGTAPGSPQLIHDIFRTFGLQKINVSTSM
jgi:hypothetical protein